MSTPTPVVTTKPYLPVDEPPWPPRQAALYAAATMVEHPQADQWSLGVTYPTNRCAGAGVWPVACPIPGGAAKSASGMDIFEGRPMWVWAGIECAPDIAAERLRQDALARLTLFEETTVEAVFASGDAATGIAPWLATAAAVDVTGATPLSLRAGLGRLEAAIRARYGGPGIIHAPAGMTPGFAAITAIVSGRPSLSTWNGNRWSFGNYSGAAPGTPTVAGNWIYATGAVTIHRGPVRVAEAMDVIRNRDLLIAERALVIAVECEVLAVQIDPALPLG